METPYNKEPPTKVGGGVGLLWTESPDTNRLNNTFSLPQDQIHRLTWIQSHALNTA